MLVALERFSSDNDNRDLRLQVICHSARTSLLLPAAMIELLCRSYDLKSYECGILKSRVERFSTMYACCFITAAEVTEAAGSPEVAGEGQAAADMLLTASSIGELR